MSAPKRESFRKLSTNSIVASLCPGQSGSLKTRPDGTILDGHHRIAVLRERGIDVDALPREIILPESAEEEQT
jgi:hypothetical protein